MGCQYAYKEDIVLVNGYEGYFAIVYNHSNGISEMWDKDRLVQRIPSNGILMLNFPRKSGITDANIYYESKLICKLEDYSEGSIDYHLSATYANFDCQKSLSEDKRIVIIIYGISKSKLSNIEFKEFEKRLQKSIN